MAENYDPEFVKELLEAAKKPCEAKFDNIVDMLRWLNVYFAEQEFQDGPSNR